MGEHRPNKRRRSCPASPSTVRSLVSGGVVSPAPVFRTSSSTFIPFTANAGGVVSPAPDISRRRMRIETGPTRFEAVYDNEVGPWVQQFEKRAPCGLHAGAIFAAASMGDQRAIRRLAANKADLTKSMDPHGMTPLHVAAFQGHAQVVKALLEFPAVDETALTYLGFTALDVASHDAEAVLKMWSQLNKDQRSLVQRIGFKKFLLPAWSVPLHHKFHTDFKVKVTAIIVTLASNADFKDSQDMLFLLANAYDNTLRHHSGHNLICSMD